MVTKKQLQNLARGRVIRQRNLQMQRRRRFVKVPRNVQIINPRFINPDLDITNTDVGGTNEKISANETLFAGIDDIVSKSLRGKK